MKNSLTRSLHSLKKVLIAFLLTSVVSFTQIPAYYSPVDFTQTGLELKDDLSDLITTTNTSPASYAEVWDILKVGDLDPTNSSVVLLIYGYNDEDGNVITDRTRNKNANGGFVGEWNREHVFPKSLGSPNLGTSGPGSDPHNLRSSDVQANGNRSNKKYANGSGDAGNVGSNWFPGEEWKGDAARIIMYMYLRYGSRCLPSAVTVGTSNAIDPSMINLLLDWNAEDEVSTLELNRNNTIQSATGNRNPFIDNPALATQIWGGTEATDTWGVLSTTQYHSIQYSLFPNPSLGLFSLDTDTPLTSLFVTNLNGKIVYSESQLLDNHYKINLTGYAAGTYIVNATNKNGSTHIKIQLQ